MKLGLGLGLGTPPRRKRAGSLWLQMLYGQSLSIGTTPGTASVVSSSPSSTHLMFNGGVRVHYNDPDANANVNSHVYDDTMATLTPLQEQLVGTNYGETFAVGMGEQIADRSLFVSTGRGAYPIDSLRRDTSAGFFHFSNTYASALNAKLLADACGYTLKIGPMIWKQGEADGAIPTSKANYKTKLEALRADFEACLPYAVLDSVSPFKMVTDQQALNNANYAEIAVAVIELHRSNANLPCAGPTYWCTFNAANDLHFTSAQYRNYGEHLGRVVEAVKADSWNPCHINSQPTRSGTTITVPIYVPEGALVVDTTLVASVANKGFTYSDANITDVTITDDGSTDHHAVVTITLDAAAAGTLRYAYHNGTTEDYIGPTYGARGNLRDSSTLTSNYGSTHLYNWLCVDSWEVA